MQSAETSKSNPNQGYFRQKSAVDLLHTNGWSLNKRPFASDWSWNKRPRKQTTNDFGGRSSPVRTQFFVVLEILKNKFKTSSNVTGVPNIIDRFKWLSQIQALRAWRRVRRPSAQIFSACGKIYGTLSKFVFRAGTITICTGTTCPHTFERIIPLTCGRSSYFTTRVLEGYWSLQSHF